MERAIAIIDTLKNTKFPDKELAESTKQDYKSGVIRLYTNKVDAFDDEDNIVSNVLKVPELSWNQYRHYIKICCVVRNGAQLPKQKLNEAMNNEEFFHKNAKDKKIVSKTENLPTIAQLREHLEGLFLEDKYREYIINYLLINYCVRNKDVDVTVTTDISNINDNELIICHDKVIYVRRNYKTFETYGAKEILINDVRFLYACREYIGKKTSRYLLETPKGTKIEDSGLSKYVSSRTFNKIGEGRIFKVMIRKIGKELEELCESRGTDIRTMMEYYVNDKGSEKQ